MAYAACVGRSRSSAPRFFLSRSVDLFEKTILYRDVPIVSPTFPPSIPSTVNKSFDERIAFRAVVTPDLVRISAMLRRHKIPSWDRRDLAQDILLAALEGWRKRGGEIAEPERWFHGIILNHVRRWRQRRFLEMTRSEEEGAEEEAIDKTCNAEEFLMSEERRRLLYQLYDELPVDHLDAVIAREVDDLTFEEIAVAFERPVSTVYGYYVAGMKELRAALERWKAKQRDRGALLLPLTLDALFDADRNAPPEPLDEAELERAWRRHQQALRGAGQEDGAPASTARLMRIPRFFGLTAALPVIGSILASQPSVDAVRSAAALLDNTLTPVARANSPAATAPVASASSAPGSGAPAPASAATGATQPQAVPAASTNVRQDPTAYMTEQVMLDKARAAFTQGDMQTALKALGEIEQKYPSGVYARARDRMWIEALVGLGRTAEACRRAERFRRAYPTGPLPAQLDPLCPGRR